MLLSLLCCAMLDGPTDDLVDTEGHEHSVASSPDPESVLVLAWSSTSCPQSKLYAPRLAALAAELPSPARMFVVFTGSAEEPESVRQLAEAAGLDCPLVLDPDGRLARTFGVSRTTECVVLDHERELVYRGPLDDQYGYRRDHGGVGTYRRESPRTRFVRDAIEAAREGRPAPRAFADATGCAITFPTADAEPNSEAPTFHRDVQSILQRHCQDCHHPSGSAPFSLLEAQNAKGVSAMIAEVVEEGRMPPWNADPSVGTFRNARGLSAGEIATLRAWADAGAPAGDPNDAPVPRAFAEGWQIGEPDVVYEVEEVELPAEGRLPYRYVRVRTRFEEDRWIQAAQFQNSSPAVVHHVLAFIATFPPPKRVEGRPWTPALDPNAILRDMNREERRRILPRMAPYAFDFQQGLGGGLYGYFLAGLPGDGPIVYPSGEARLLPARATLIFQIHYTPVGVAMQSGTKLGLKFADAPPRHVRDTRAASTLKIEIPPGAADHVVRARYEFPRNADLISMRPHLHLRGKHVSYVLHQGGATRTLLEVPHYDFDWQLDYELDEPVAVAPGDVLEVIARYDNSDANPYNPDPEAWVYFGLQTEDEMMIGYFDVRWAATEDEGP